MFRKFVQKWKKFTGCSYNASYHDSKYCKKNHLIWVKNYLHLKSAENIHYMIIIATQTWRARALSAGPLCTTSCIYLIRTTEVSHQCKNQRFSSGPEGQMCRKRGEKFISSFIPLLNHDIKTTDNHFAMMQCSTWFLALIPDVTLTTTPAVLTEGSDCLLLLPCSKTKIA